MSEVFQTDVLTEFQSLRTCLEEQVLGQETLIERMLIALLADGHLLVEGPPGLAKTRSVKALAQGIAGKFQRIQFTPDMLPADLTGSDIFRPETGTFEFIQGPLFHSIILADEINRAPAKVQSALLESMAERQITVGGTTYHLPELFMVMATQNPLEHEGTYPLPEAQLDRFMLHVRIDYPEKAVLRRIMDLHRSELLQSEPEPAAILEPHQVMLARKQLLGIHLDTHVQEYMIALVDATHPQRSSVKKLREWIRWGASPRAALALEHGCRARAWLNQRDYISPEDVQNLAADTLRHRLVLDFRAVAQNITADDCIVELIRGVPAP